MLPGIQGLDVINFNAADPLLDQYPPGGVIPINARHVQVRRLGKIGPEAVGVATLAAVVQLRFEGYGKLFGQANQVVGVA